MKENLRLIKYMLKYLAKQIPDDPSSKALKKIEAEIENAQQIDKYL